MSDFTTICDFKVSAISLDQTLDIFMAWLSQERVPARVAAFVNPHSLEVARRDVVFSNALCNFDMLTADGIGIILASKILNGKITERVCGPDVFHCFCKRLDSKKLPVRMVFIGSSEKNLQILEEKFRKDFPSLVFAGSCSPPYKAKFSDEDNRIMLEHINACKPDVLWVGLGAPKQEKWALEIRDKVTAKIILPVGAVFDFYTGRVKLPPKWAQDAGLTFLFRFFQQPKRLFRRNLDSPIFLARVFMQKLKKD